MYIFKSVQCIISLLIIIPLTTSACGKNENKGTVSQEITGETDKVSYSLGTQLGNSLKQGKIKIDSGIFSQGFKHALNDKTLEYTEEEMAQIMESFQNEMQEKMSASEDPGEFKTDMKKVSYIIGTQLGQNFRLGGIDVNADIFVRGLDDIGNDTAPALTEAEMEEVMKKFQEDMSVKQEAEYNVALTTNRAEASAFLVENAMKPGITTLPDSLQYEVMNEGSGSKPQASDTVRVHYRGTRLDGTVFDSSYSRNQPAEFPLNGVIPGWTEVLQLMKTGAKWKVYIPPELAYGTSGRPPTIGPNLLLIFEIELLEIVEK